MPDTHKLQYGNNYNHWKIMDLVLDLNIIILFPTTTQNLTRHTYPKHHALIVSFLSVLHM